MDHLAVQWSVLPYMRLGHNYVPMRKLRTIIHCVALISKLRPGSKGHDWTSKGRGKPEEK